MQRWLSFETDQGAVLWGILCCWLAVAGNVSLLGLGVSIFWVVPFDLFGVPILVSLALWVFQRKQARV